MGGTRRFLSFATERAAGIYEPRDDEPGWGRVSVHRQNVIVSPDPFHLMRFKADG